MWPLEAIHYVGHAAPAALLFQNVTWDTLVDPLEALQYQQAGSEPKQVVWYDSVHWPLNEQVFQDNGRWLQRYIGPGKTWLVPVPNYRGSAIVIDRLLLTWLILVVSSLGYFVYSSRKGAPMRWEHRMIWLLAIVVLGPLGLAICIVWRRRAQRSPSQAASH